MASALKRIILRKLARFPLDECPTIHPRELDLGEPMRPCRGNPIVALSGVRRSGKTHRLFQEMRLLLERGVPRERICYFDFEDDRLGIVTPQLGSMVIDAFRSLHPEAQEGGLYLFLDGIQAMEGWCPWVRRVANRLDATVCLAGSPSGLRAAGARRMRDADIVVRRLLPYSFSEYLRATGDGPVDAPGPDRPRKATSQLRDAFIRYLTSGGFPKTVHLEGEQRVKLLQEYESRIVLEDVVVAANAPDPQVATRFAHRTMSANSQTFSFRRAVGSFDKAGIKVEKDRLRALLASILAAELMFRIPCFDLASGEESRDQCKLYAVDPGLARACARAHGNTVSFLLEDVVYLELLRRTAREGRQLRCLRNRENNHEVDFVTGDPLGDGPSHLYQVTWSIDKKRVRHRELRSILEAFDEVARLRGDGSADLPQATIIIGDSTPQSLARHRRYLKTLGDWGRRITLVPAPEWLLGEPDGPC